MGNTTKPKGKIKYGGKSKDVTNPRIKKIIMFN